MPMRGSCLQQAHSTSYQTPQTHAAVTIEQLFDGDLRLVLATDLARIITTPHTQTVA